MLRGYLVGQAALLLAYWFVPVDSWLQPVWQTADMTISVVFLLLGVRRSRPEPAAAWWLIGAGTFLNGCGVVVDMIASRVYGMPSSMNAAHIFWAALFPMAALGLGMMVRRAVAREEASAMLRNTVICVPVIFFTGIYAWQFVAWRSHFAESVPLVYKLVVTAYPFGDFVFLALLLRLLLSLGPRNVSLRLMLGWLVLLLPSDIGWPMFVRAGTDPSRGAQYFMEATWMAACALLGAATWHPDVHRLAPSVQGRVPGMGLLGWCGLLACALVGPLVVLFQIWLDRVYLLNTFWG